MKTLLAVKVVVVLSLIALSATAALGAGPVPNAPTNLTGTLVSQQTQTAIKLDWTDNSLDETSFRVERSTNGVLFAQLGTVDADVTSFVDDTVGPDVLYYYRVFALNANGDSRPSNLIALFTADTQAPPTPTPTFPPMGDQLSTHNVRFEWSPVSDMSGVKYRIVVNDLANGITLHDVSGITSNNISLLCYDSVYEWYVYAYDGAGNVSLVSQSYYCTVAATDPMAPDVTVTAPNGGEVLTAGSSFAITWYALDQDFTSTPDLIIGIFFSHNNGGSWEQSASLGNNPGAFNWIVPNVLCDATCLIRVTAENQAGMIGSDDSDFAFSIVPSSSGATAVANIAVTDSILPIDDLQMAFGNVAEGKTSPTQAIAIANNGDAALTVSGIQLAGTDASQFALDLSGGINPCGSASPTIDAGGICTVTVTFGPLSTGEKSATLDIASDDPDAATVSVALTGTGLSATNGRPSAPALISPADGQTGLRTDITLKWQKSQDPDGDAITYRVSYCTDETFSACPSVTVANSGTPKAFSAYAGLPGLLLIGAIFAIPRSERKKLMLLMIALVMIGGVVVACSGGGGGDATPTASQELSHRMSGLNAGATYYWKVVADDGKGGIVESHVWSFTTQ